MVGNGSKGKETSVSVDITEQTPFGHRFDGSNKIPCHLRNLPDLNNKFRCQGGGGDMQEEKREEEVSTSQHAAWHFVLLETIEPLCAPTSPAEAPRPLLISCTTSSSLAPDSEGSGSVGSS